jgi:hypothetical protein
MAEHRLEGEVLGSRSTGSGWATTARSGAGAAALQRRGVHRVGRLRPVRQPGRPPRAIRGGWRSRSAAADVLDGPGHGCGLRPEVAVVRGRLESGWPPHGRSAGRLFGRTAILGVCRDCICEDSRDLLEQLAAGSAARSGYRAR